MRGLFGHKLYQNMECLARILAYKAVVRSEFKFKKKSCVMEPNETSLAMMNELSTMSQAYVPNFIRNADENDQSFD